MSKYTVKFHYKGKSASTTVTVDARSEHDAREPSESSVWTK